MTNHKDTCASLNQMLLSNPPQRAACDCGAERLTKMEPVMYRLEKKVDSAWLPASEWEIGEPDASWVDLVTSDPAQWQISEPLYAKKVADAFRAALRQSSIGTCDKCNLYKPSNDKDYGECELLTKWAIEGVAVENGAVAWDYENYSCGVHVGPKFGCLHWENRND